MEHGIGLDVLCSSLGLSREEIEQALTARLNYRPGRTKKKSGGFRKHFSPPPEIRLVQTCLRRLLDRHYNYLRRRDRLLNTVHGCVARHSPLTNALKHRYNKYFYLCDLRDAFGQVTEDRLRVIFSELPFAPSVIEVLVKLVSYRGAIPQGALTSPVLFNLACREMDVRLKRELGPSIVVTRYVDDICVSGSDSADVGESIAKIRAIIKECGFRVARNKCKRRSVDYGSVEVTGLSISAPLFALRNGKAYHYDEIRLSRKKIRRYRAMLHLACQGKRSQSEVQGNLGWVRDAYRGRLPPALEKPYREYRIAVGEGRVPLG
jgi:Reverse transcriptase (RNA-dependent DNA polymerase).